MGDQDPRAGGGAEGCGQQPEVPGGGRGEGQPEGEDLQGADQDPDCQAEAGRGPCRVCREVSAEAAEGGGQAGGRARLRAEKFKAITEELEQTFAEMSGY